MVTMLIVLFILEFVNSILKTLRNILVVKGGKFASGMISALSIGLGTVLVKQIASIDGVGATVAVSVSANFLGSITAKFILEKFTKEKLWKVSMSLPYEELESVTDELYAEDISYIDYPVNNGYNMVEAFSNNKEDSAKIRKIINSKEFHIKYNVQEVANSL